MGLFDRRSGGRGKAGAAERSDALAGFSGMRVEILDGDGGLLFVARLSVGASGSASLQQLTVPLEPIDPEGRRVRLRGYAEDRKYAVHMEGTIRYTDGDRWAVEGLQVVNRGNDRAFFRQGVDTEGQILPLNRMRAGARPCSLVNISAGGACIRTAEEFVPDDRLMLTCHLLPNRPVSPLICAVRRVGAQKRGLTEYGCQFVDITQNIQDEIAKTIMELQMRQRKR